MYTIPPGDGSLDVQVKVAKERLLYLAQKRDYSGSQIYDFRSFNEVALSQTQIKELASLYPPKSCGDGVRVTGEECDDGNILNNDGCSSLCTIESGYVCRGGNTTYLAADACDLGEYMLNLNFDNSSYGTSNIDITTYNVMEWSKNPSLPLLFEHIMKDGNVETQRRGNVELNVGPKYARSGTNGLRLYFRDYFFTKEYEPSANETINFELPSNNVSVDLQSKPEPNGWTDPASTDTDLGQKVTNVSGTDGGWVHGPWEATTARVQNVFTSVKQHSLVRIQMRYWAHGDWCNNNYATIDVAGDTVFAHNKYQNGNDNRFVDCLHDGPAYSTAYVSPMSNPSSPSTTEGFLAWRYWNNTGQHIHPACDGASCPSSFTWRTFDVDVTVPHTGSTLEINVRAVFGTCGVTNALFAFDKVNIQVSDLTPNPFRPYNLAQLRNRKRTQSDMHSWIQLDTPTEVQQTSWLSFSFQANNIARKGRQFIINMIDLDHADTTFSHSACLSTLNCGQITGCTACRPENIYYRICYWNEFTGSGTSGCDESHFPTYGVWHDETIVPSEKLASIYTPTIAYAPRKMRFQFLSFSSGETIGGRDSEFDVLLDDIRVGTPTKYSGTFGCGDIQVSSNTNATGANTTTFTVNDTPLRYAEVGDAGICYLHIPYKSEPVAASVVCGTTDAFTTFVNTLTSKRNDRVFAASYGTTVDCNQNCIHSIIALGGVGVTWKLGSSLVLMGRMGAKTGSLPMRFEHLGEGRITASNFIVCPDIATTTVEVNKQFSSIGPPLGLLNSSKPLKTKFVITTASGGYVGCYRDKH